MANNFNAITTGTGGLSTSGDTSGTFAWQKDGVTKASLDASGNLTATSFIGSGASLTGLPSPAGGATNTGPTTTNVTLTASSNKVQSLSVNQSSALYYTLPDATTISTTGGPIFNIQPYNNGTYLYLKNADGGIIYQCANTSATYDGSTNVYLLDKSTAAGSWSFNGNPTTTAIYSPVTYKADTNIVSGTQQIKMLSSTAFVIMYKSSSDNTYYAIAGTISGKTITMGTAVQVSATTTYSIYQSTIVGLSSTAAMCVMSGTTNTVLIPLVISGNTITVGSSSTVGAATSSDTAIKCAEKISSTTLLFRACNTTNYNSFGVWVITHNGTSAPSVGSVATRSTYTGYSYDGFTTVINSTLAISTYSAPSTGYLTCETLSISGTSLTSNGAVTLISSSQAGNMGPCAGVVSNGTKVIGSYNYVNNGYFNYWYSINISGTTPSYVANKTSVGSSGNGNWINWVNHSVPVTSNPTSSTAGYIAYPTNQGNGWDSGLWYKYTLDANGFPVPNSATAVSGEFTGPTQGVAWLDSSSFVSLSRTRLNYVALSYVDVGWV